MIEEHNLTDNVALGDEASAQTADAGIAPQSAASRPMVWVLTGSRVGDNNQMLALADALGLPFEIKQLTYNRLRRFAFLRDRRLVYLTRQARRKLTPASWLVPVTPSDESTGRAAVLVDSPAM